VMNAVLFLVCDPCQNSSDCAALLREQPSDWAALCSSSLSSRSASQVLVGGVVANSARMSLKVAVSVLSMLSKGCLIVALKGKLLRSLRRAVSRSFAAPVTALTALVPGRTMNLGCQDSVSVIRVLRVLGIKIV
jgi:hypothetical protein